LREFRPE